MLPASFLRLLVLAFALVVAPGQCDDSHGLVKRAKKAAAHHTPSSSMAADAANSSAAAPSQASHPSIVIDTIFSTAWNYSTPGGVDPNLVKHNTVNISFVPIGGNITYPEQSINLTNGDAIIGVEIHENRAFQQMLGAGCGISDAASIALQAIKEAKPDEYADLMNVFFNTDEEWAITKGGAGLNVLRSPLGASDFSFETYSYDDTADGSPDVNLTLFTIERAPKMWQTHLDIQKLNPKVLRMFAPWSPPGWMKNSSRMIGGGLEEKYWDVFARYLTRSMVDIKQKLGSTPWQLSLQNEPLYLPDKYPGNKVNAVPDAVKIGDLTRKYLNAAGLKDVTLTAYDHNWDHPEYPTAVFDNSKSFGSVSWHCYGGEPSAQNDFNLAFPGRQTIMSECTRVTQNGDEAWSNLRKSAAAYLTNSIEQGTQAIVLWNCALQVDENGFTTPHLPNVCSNCAAPVLFPPAMTGDAKLKSQTGNATHSMETLDSRSAVTTNRSLAAQDGNSQALPVYVPPGGPQDTHGKFRLTSDFALLAHLTRAIRPRDSEEQWAVRVGAATTEQKNDFPDGERIKVQAYRTSIGSDGKRRWSLTLLQKHDHFLTGVYNDVTATIKFKNMVANVTLPVGLHTLTWVA